MFPLGVQQVFLSRVHVSQHLPGLWVQPAPRRCAADTKQRGGGRERRAFLTQEHLAEPRETPGQNP